ncbi:hypothetical protein GT018_22705 [Streptomyces sp. SID4912]|uniref:hypothetical protein n=2 Tax=Streptomyces TaxID=1883 RepID=UPI00048BB675|nr:MULTISPECIES: hypothetical protein [unclassified Streptomyces]MYR76257.1 hypothetical protein [Streptomyces sp. SID4925]MYY18381.1 hypothetical protein [Streptomyces sp. SID4912]SBU93510.1 hypothetical protein YUMDRAFT_04738 [Streptomyces sp. OspMP-M45]SCE20868.1 hypothetical protein GA0115241_110855 [Streptomyces sp. DpondAA-D4]
MEQQEASKDAVMTRIGQAVMLLHGGDREEARNRFGVLWAEIGECGGALHRCTLAHYMADTQDDPEDELVWDLRALASAQGLTGGGATDAGTALGTGPSGGAGVSGGEGASGGTGVSGGAGGAEHRDALAVRAFLPSLHLALAADYFGLRRFEAARTHLDRGWEALGTLDDDGYGDGVRTALGRLERRMRGSGAGR